MNTQARTRKSSAKPSARLGAYLATGIGASSVAISSSNAAIVNLNIGPSGFDIGQINGGVSSGMTRMVYPFPEGGSRLLLVNMPDSFLVGLYAIGFEFAGSNSAASPTNFALNDTIGSGASWQSNPYTTLFQNGPYNSPDFGPGSYMGFETAQGNYGWLEVTWDSKLSQFEILSGAYESTPGTSILAGATGVPEPSSSLLALVAGGAAFARRRRQRAD